MSKTEITPTPGVWLQGRTLSTARTRQWTKEQWNRNDLIERCMVFTNFSSADEGKGR